MAEDIKQNSSWKGEGWDKQSWDKSEWKHQNVGEQKNSDTKGLGIVDAISYLEEMSVIEKNTDEKLEKILFTKAKIRDFVIVGAKLGLYLSAVILLHVIIRIILHILEDLAVYLPSGVEMIFFQYAAAVIGLMASYYFASWSAKTIQGPFTAKAVKSFYAGWFMSLLAIGFGLFVTLIEIGKLMVSKKEAFLEMSKNEIFSAIFEVKQDAIVSVYEGISSALTPLSFQALILSFVLSMFPIVFYYVKTKLIDDNAEDTFKEY